jgi:gliding motility-associated-like protein
MKRFIHFLLFLLFSCPALLMAQNGKEYFVTVDASTGHFNKVNLIPGVHWIRIGPSYVTYDKQNQIYFFNGDDSIGQWHLYGINAKNGTIKYNPLFPVLSDPNDNIMELQYDNVTKKLYGLHWDNSIQTEFLVSINPSTGAFTIIDSIPNVKLINTVSYTVFDEKNHLFIFRGSDWSSNWKLYAVDVLTGKVISSPPFTNFSNPKDNVCELKFNNTTQQLVGLHWDDAQQTEYLVTIDSGTAKVNRIDSIPGVKWIYLMPNYTVLDENKNQFIFKGGTAKLDFYLYTIDIATGKIVNKVDFPKVCGPDDNVIELHHDQASNQLYGLHWEQIIPKLRDTLVCPNTSLYMNVPNNAKWSNGDSGRVLRPLRTGYYSYQCRLQCDSSIKKDSLFIKIKYKSTGLPKDTLMCNSKSLFLVAKTGFQNYLWSSKYGPNKKKIDTAGTYILQVRDYDRCTYSDTVIVKIQTATSPKLGPNLHFCNPKGIQLKELSGYKFKSYLWNQSDTNKTIAIKSNGYVQLDTKDSNDCIGSDTIYIAVTAGVKPELGPDLQLCYQSYATIKNLTSYKYLEYFWNDGDKHADKTTSIAATYILEVLDSNQCKNKDTINISQINSIIKPPNLGYNKFICKGDSFKLGSTNTYTKYLWNGIDTSRFINTTKAGMYYLEAWNSNGCKTEDSFRLMYYPTVKPNLGADKLFCIGTYVALYLTNGTGSTKSFMWSTGEKKELINVANEGTYILTTNDYNNCNLSDTIKTKFLPVNKPNLGKDSALCRDSSITVRDYSGYKFLDYNWSGGKYTKTINAYPGSTVILSARDKNNCYASDTVYYPVQKFPALNFPNDTDLCEGAEFILRIRPNGSQILWGDGTTDSIRTFKTSSKNILKISTKRCVHYTYVNVNVYTYPKLKISYPTLCDNPIYTLDAGEAQSYYWNTGELTRHITGSGSQLYWVDAANGPCVSSDTIKINYVERLPLFVPNAFSPNNDGINEVFEPVSNFELNKLRIYNRWGELVFESNNSPIKWDGTYKGQLCPAGVYVAYIVYQDCSLKTINTVDYFELLR